MKGNLTKSSNKLLTLVISIIFLIFILVGYLFYLKPYAINMKTNYIPTKRRNTYIIQNANDILLNNYISKKSNTLIVFWATWCPSCIEESNDLNEFINNNPDIPVIVVSHDKTIEKVEQYLKENNFNWFVILDSERKIRASLDTDTKGIPSTYLLNKDLNVISKEITQMSEKDFYDFYNFNFNK